MADEPANVDGITGDAPKDVTLDPMAEELKKLEAMQQRTEKVAMKIGAEALAYMMSMGWTFGAALTEIKDEEGKVVKHKAELVVRPCTLAEWQRVQKEKLRKSLTL